MGQAFEEVKRLWRNLGGKKLQHELVREGSAFNLERSFLQEENR